MFSSFGVNPPDSGFHSNSYSSLSTSPFIQHGWYNILINGETILHSKGHPEKSTDLHGEEKREEGNRGNQEEKFSLITQWCLTLCDPMNHSMPGLPVHQLTPGVHPNPCPQSWWCHPTISFSVVPFSSCSQSFPTSGSFPMSQFFTSGGQSIGVSASASVLPMNTKDWSPLGWTCWISLLFMGLSRVFSNTTVQKHQFFGAQLSNSHTHTWLLENP